MSIEKIKETLINDGKGGKVSIKDGDKVDILPVHLMEQDDEHGDYFAKQQFNFLLRWLGEGPYEISWIGQWPCGDINIYINTPKTNGAGVKKSDFKFVSN